MILGYFEGLRPYVECDLHIPRFDIYTRIPLLFDTGADGTCLHQKTASELRIPFHLLRDPKTSRGIGREEPTYFREPATLSFDGVMIYLTNVDSSDMIRSVSNLGCQHEFQEPPRYSTYF